MTNSREDITEAAAEYEKGKPITPLQRLSAEEYQKLEFKFRPPCAGCSICVIRYCDETGTICDDFHDYLARAEEEVGIVEGTDETDVHRA